LRAGRIHARGPCRCDVRACMAIRANQTNIIDLTCDLEIRKITDGERLEPIIIVNIDRPSFAAVVVADSPRSCLSLSLFLSFSRPRRLARRPASVLLSFLPRSLPLFLLRTRLPLLPSLPLLRSLFPRVSLQPVHRPFLCPELLFILISRAFCFSVVSGPR